MQTWGHCRLACSNGNLPRLPWCWVEIRDDLVRQQIGAADTKQQILWRHQLFLVAIFALRAAALRIRADGSARVDTR